MLYEQNVPHYSLYAIKYAHAPARRSAANFLMTHDVHDIPMPMDFFVWVAVHGERVILIDSGADKETCERRGYEFLRSPADALGLIGIQPEHVTDLVVTHMHWDHMGNLDCFPNAEILIHKNEIAHATGCQMCHPLLRRPYDVDQVCDVIRALYAGRVRFNEGDIKIAPGVSAHLVGGHTPGLQVVKISTARGNVVLASDAMHYYDNAIDGNPFPVVVNVTDYLNAFKRIGELADSAQHVVAGHDPIVTSSFPSYSAETEGIVLRLDVEPLHPLPEMPY